jgi:hypothetical protein
MRYEQGNKGPKRSAPIVGMEGYQGKWPHWGFDSAAT